MKKLLMYLAVISITFGTFAQSPQKMSYQCVVRNSGGALVANQGVGIKISILQGSPTGTLVFQETYSPNPQTNVNGLATLEIGDGSPLFGTFSTIDWSTGPYFLKTETDPAGGTNYTISGTSQLLSVPYALYAKTVDSYPETDPVFIAHAASGVTYTLISNWNTAYSWGNHASAGYLTSFTELDPIFGAWDKTTGISITASQVSDFITSVTNNPAVAANTAKNSYPTADAIKLSAITGTNTGDETSATIKSKLGISTLSGSNTGDQTLPTLASLGGVASNTAITGATNTKITYDAKGLVTAGAAATTADIAASTDKNYVTDAQLTVIGNTSGINSGDNAVNTLYSGLATNATHTGDVTGSGALTLTTVNSNIGTFNNITINGKGLATAGSNVSYLTSEADPTVKAITGIVKSNGATISAATAGTDYLTPNGSAASLTGFPTFNQNTTGSAASFTSSLVGEVTGTQGATVVGNAAVIGKVLTGYVSGAGTVAATDNILQAIQKLNGNDPAHYIGESYGGGIVFYVYDNGKHGLIAATLDQSNEMRWDAGVANFTMARADGVGAGKSNTTLIIAGMGFGDGGTYAARICNEYSVTVDGVTYGDWYLPSKYELNLLYLQKTVVGGFDMFWYWSSTSPDIEYVWFQSFTDGGQYPCAIGTAWGVRAIRSF
jgi:hypothetical protein